MTALTLAHLVLGSTPEETVDAAAAAGFAAVGVRICARRPGDAFTGTPIVGNLPAARALRRRAEDAGLRLSNVSAYQFYPEVDREQLAPVVDATHALGAPIIVANGFDRDLSRFTERFARYCEAADAAGIRVALEFLPYSAVRDLPTALRIVDASGAANAGILPDALHLDRSGGTPNDLAIVPPDRIVFAQLCDAMRLKTRPDDQALLQEARTARLPAGEGELPLFAFLDALPDGIEIEYEVARADLASRSAHEKAQAARQDADRFMLRYREHRVRQASGERPAAGEA